MDEKLTNYFEEMRKSLHSILDENGTAVYDYAVGDMICFFHEIYLVGASAQKAACRGAVENIESVNQNDMQEWQIIYKDRALAAIDTAAPKEG